MGLSGNKFRKKIIGAIAGGIAAGMLAGSMLAYAFKPAPPPRPYVQVARSIPFHSEDIVKSASLPPFPSEQAPPVRMTQMKPRSQERVVQGPPLPGMVYTGRVCGQPLSGVWHTGDGPLDVRFCTDDDYLALSQSNPLGRNGYLKMTRPLGSIERRTNDFSRLRIAGKDVRESRRASLEVSLMRGSPKDSLEDTRIASYRLPLMIVRGLPPGQLPTLSGEGSTMEEWLRNDSVCRDRYSRFIDGRVRESNNDSIDSNY